MGIAQTNSGPYAPILSLIMIYTLSILGALFGMSSSGTVPCEAMNSTR